MLMVTIAFSDDTGGNAGTKLYDRLTGARGAAFQVCVRADAGPPPNNAL